METEKGEVPVKYAIIADVHGNAMALRLVIEDARRQGAQAFLFAGDYCVRAPWGDEVIELLRAAENAGYVRGNEEKYLHLPEGDDAQFALSRRAARHMKPENIAWVDALPERLDFACEGVEIHIAHSSEEFIGDGEMRCFKTRQLALRYPEGPISHEYFLDDVRTTLAGQADLQQRLREMPGGVYIFGHTHSQWHAQFGDVMLINPGSAGEALDCQQFGAPYTLLTVKNGYCMVEERRVHYDVEALIAQVKQSGMYAEMPVWCEILFRGWRLCREHTMFFLRYAEAYARKIGDARRPFMPDTWNAAYEAWISEPNLWVMVEDGDFPR